MRTSAYRIFFYYTSHVAIDNLHIDSINNVSFYKIRLIVLLEHSHVKEGMTYGPSGARRVSTCASEKKLPNHRPRRRDRRQFMTLTLNLQDTTLFL